MNYRENLLETLEQKTLINIILDLQNQISDLESDLEDRGIEQELQRENIKDLRQTIECLRLISKANVQSQNFNN